MAMLMHGTSAGDFLKFAYAELLLIEHTAYTEILLYKTNVKASNRHF